MKFFCSRAVAVLLFMAAASSLWAGCAPRDRVQKGPRPTVFNAPLSKGETAPGPVRYLSGIRKFPGQEVVFRGQDEDGRAASGAISGGRHVDGAIFGRDNKILSPRALAELARPADFIIIGEDHGNREHHRMQARILHAMAETGLSPAIGLEWMPHSLQSALDRMYEGRFQESELAAELGWEEGAGRVRVENALPVFTAALDRGLPLLALGLSGEARNAVREKGFEQARQEPGLDLPAVIIGPPPEQRAILQAVYTRHYAGEETASGKEGFEAFVAMQSLRDTAVAERALALFEQEGRPVVILAGLFRVAHGYGIAHRLRVLAPEVQVLTIMPANTFPIDQRSAREADFFFSSRSQIEFSTGPEIVHGAVFAQEGDKIVVRSVEKGSQAEGAGLRPGDLVRGFQGLSFRHIKEMGRLWQRLEKLDNTPETLPDAGKKRWVLSVERSGEPMDISLDQPEKGREPASDKPTVPSS